VRNAASSIDEDLGPMQRVFEEVLTRTSPEDAAKTILKSVKNGDAKCLIGLDAKVMDLTVRALGSNYQRLFATINTVMESRLKLR
jgi:hypothetical protein